MAPFIDFIIRHRLFLGRNVIHQMKALGLKENDLQITQPRGVYDPKLV
jgi:hypothetical protein